MMVICTNLFAVAPVHARGLTNRDTILRNTFSVILPFYPEITPIGCCSAPFSMYLFVLL